MCAAKILLSNNRSDINEPRIGNCFSSRSDALEQMGFITANIDLNEQSFVNLYGMMQDNTIDRIAVALFIDQLNNSIFSLSSYGNYILEKEITPNNTGDRFPLVHVFKSVDSGVDKYYFKGIFKLEAFFDDIDVILWKEK